MTSLQYKCKLCTVHVEVNNQTNSVWYAQKVTSEYLLTCFLYPSVIAPIEVDWSLSLVDAFKSNSALFRVSGSRNDKIKQSSAFSSSIFESERTSKQSLKCVSQFGQDPTTRAYWHKK